jgi:DNA repair protein RecO (recombination protein O)
MQQKTKGIVLHYLKYGETGMIVTVYTEAFGRTSFLMQGIRGKKAKVKANLIQPLFLLEMELSHKPGRDLQRATEIRIAKPFSSVPFDIRKSAQAMFLAEFLYKVLREEESQPELFNFLFSSIQILDIIEEGIANFHLVFLIRLVKFLGFGPTDEYSEDKPYFDLENGMFVSREPTHNHYLTSNKSKVISDLLKIDFESLSKFKVNHTLRDEILENIIEYYCLHFNRSFNIKSLSVLREIT